MLSQTCVDNRIRIGLYRFIIWVAAFQCALFESNISQCSEVNTKIVFSASPAFSNSSKSFLLLDSKAVMLRIIICEWDAFALSWMLMENLGRAYLLNHKRSLYSVELWDMVMAEGPQTDEQVRMNFIAFLDKLMGYPVGQKHHNPSQLLWSLFIEVIGFYNMGNPRTFSSQFLCLRLAVTGLSLPLKDLRTFMPLRCNCQYICLITAAPYRFFPRWLLRIQRFGHIKIPMS